MSRLTSRTLFCGIVCLRNYATRNNRFYKPEKVLSQDKMARIMQKFLDKQKKKEQKGIMVGMIDDPRRSYKEPNYNTDDHTIKALNKSYMEHITEVMGSGELGALNESVAFNVTKVQINTNYQYLYVSWAPSNSHVENIDEIQEHLNYIAPKIRHIMISQRLIGHVPVIRFVQDESQLSLFALERALESADMGPDRQPDSSVLAPEALMPTVENPQTISGDRPQEMRHNLFDLDHAHLMKLVTSSPRKKPDQKRAPNPVGEYDSQRPADFNLFLRKQKYKRKQVDADAVPETLKVRVELVNQDYVEDIYEEDTWDGENGDSWEDASEKYSDKKEKLPTKGGDPNRSL